MTGGLVLLYHRIADLVSDPQCLAVSPAHFADHLDVILEHGVPMTLPALLQAARAQTLPRGAVAITFDDGYADNLLTAAPMLARAGVPATVFVSTGPFMRPRPARDNSATSGEQGAEEFWWDAVERVLLGPGTLPATLSLPVGDSRLSWDLTHAEQRTPDDCVRHAAWSVLDRRDPTPRHRAYRDLCARLQRVSAAERGQTLAALSGLASCPREPRDTHRALTLAEVATLAGLDGIAIGSHTVSHPSLAALTEVEQRTEIAGAQQVLEAITGTAVTTLAYPFGGPRDCSQQTARIATDAGITIACCTTQDRVNSATDPMMIPRVGVRDLARPAFQQLWSQWTGATRLAAPR